MGFLSHPSLDWKRFGGQSKLIFTAGFMSQMLGKSFSSMQIVALGLLLLGVALLLERIGSVLGVSHEHTCIAKFERVLCMRSHA